MSEWLIQKYQEELDIKSRTIKRLEVEVDEWRSNALSLAIRDNEQELKKEFDRALFWLRHAKPLLHSGGFNLAADDIGNFLSGYDPKLSEIK